MDPKLIDMLNRLNELSLAELAELEQALKDHGKTVDRTNTTAADIELLAEVKENLDVVRAQRTTMQDAEDARQAEADALLAEIDPEGAAAAQAEADAEADRVAAEAQAIIDGAPAPDETVVDGPAAVVEQPEPVAAAGAPIPEVRPAVPVDGPAARGVPRLPRVSRLAERRPERVKPVLTATAGAERNRPVLLAAADIPGLPAGSPVSIEQFAEGASRRFEASRKVGNNGANGEKVYFGTVKTEYPPERFLDAMDHAGNERKINGVAGQEALVASGGICAPVAVDYSLTTIATSGRPVQEAMASFGASRGGLRYVLPHTLAQVTTDGPASLWTEANDVNPVAPALKPHATFQCQTVMEAYVDAVTSITQFGNFQARYFPESIAQYLETVDAVHARLAEGNLLAQLSAGSTQVSADNYELGAARDLLAIVDRAAAAMRYRHRMAPETPLRFVYPEWLEDMVRADLARQLPGDSGSQAERLAVTDAQIDNFFAVRNINVTTVQDSPLGAAVTQGWGIQGPGQLLPWPAVTSTWLYPEGSWVFLDGGELNLGMVRDSILNRTNDFQMFSETFEKAIFRGHESQQINMRLAPTGASAGTVATYPADPGETIGS
jgi:hypothetical protein